MSPSNPNDRPTLTPAVRMLLGEVRRRIRQYVWLDGLAAAVAWLGVAFWLTLAADWFFEPSAAVRGGMLAAVAVVLVVVLARLIVRRAFVRITDGNAAMVLERRFPKLNDSLLTAVVLGDRWQASAAEHHDAAFPDDVDCEMLARTCREAAARITQLDPREVFNPRPLWLHGSAAMLLMLSVAFFTILFPDKFCVWARRALAMSNEIWPRMTAISVVDFPGGLRKAARGADLEVVVRADTRKPRVPETVEIRYFIEGGGRGRATMDRRGIARSADDCQEYAYTFRGVLADVRFDVVGGDCRLRNLRIQAVDSPAISQMTLHCELPAYIGRKQPPLPVTGVMQIPMGSRVTVLAAEANKELVSVEVGGLVEDRALPVKLLKQSDLAADHRGFSYALGPLMKDTTLLFTLVDADGIKSREPVRAALVAAPDQPPQIAVGLDGIGTAIAPRACLPAVGRVSDDYGIGRVWFEYAIDQGKPNVRSIAELARAPTVFDLANAALEARELGLKPGQKFLLSVKAADLRDLGRGPNVSSSERWLLDVVAPEQLRAMLEARELVLRQRFEQMIQEMTETRDLLSRLMFDSAVAASPLPPGKGTKKPVLEPGDEEPADSPARQRDLRFLRVEGALTNCRKGTQEALGLAEAFDDICKQLKNNRIDTEELKKRLQGGIAVPLHAMAAAMFPELDRRLDELKAVLDDSRQGPASRARAQVQAEDILLAMRKVLDHMIELEDFNEAVETLRNIVQTQKRLHERTQEFHKRKIRELLAESSKRAGSDSAEKLARQERQIADKYRRFEDVLLRMAELSAAADPRRAALLRKAIAQSKEQLIDVAFERLVDMLSKERLSRALETQTQLDQDLRSLLELLMSEDRAKSIENEKARIRDYLKQLGVIIKQQKDIQGRTAGGDDAKRLAGQQAKLADKTGGLAKTIRENEEKSGEGTGSQPEGGQPPGKSKPGEGKPDGRPQPGQPPPEEGDAQNSQDQQDQSQSPAHKRLEAARERMQEAQKKLAEARRQGAAEKQEEAILALEKAKAELEEILRQLREEEIERMLAMLEARFRKMLQMEEEVYEGTVRLDKTPPAERTHNHEIEASRLSGKQSQIVVEVDKAALLLREEGSAAAFPEAVDQMREDMRQIVVRLAQAKVNKVTQGIEEDVLAALKEMIEALKKAQKDRDAKLPPGRLGGEGQPQEPPLVDSLAELRMIRALQMRVNARTVRYSKMIEGEQADSAELVEALKRLAERQERIYRVTRDLQMGRNQ